MRENILQRLLWKEYREGWPVIAAFLVLPGLVFPLNIIFSKSDLAGAMVVMVLFGVPFAAVLWGSEKRRAVKQGRDVLAALLPATPLQDWLASFLIPAIAVGICGGWMYLLYTRTPVGMSERSVAVVIQGALVAATAFVISSFLSKGVSHLLGITIGTIWIICTLHPLVGPTMVSTLAHPAIPIVLAIAALGLSELRKTGTQRIKALGLTVMVLVIVGVFHSQISCIAQGLARLPQASISGIPYTGFSTWDGSTVSVTGYEPPTETNSVIYEDRHLGSWHASKRIQRPFPYDAVPGAIDAHKRVYVLSERPGHDEITIFRWDTQSNAMEQVYKFSGWDHIDISPASPTHDCLETASFEPMGWADCEGSRLILRLHSTMGTGQDLLLIDLAHGTHKLIVANSFFAWSKATWTKDKVFLTGYLPPLEIDTKNYSVKPLISGGVL